MGGIAHRLSMLNYNVRHSCQYNSMLFLKISQRYFLDEFRPQKVHIFHALHF